MQVIEKARLDKPSRLRMSYEEYLAWAGEDVRAEWVNGAVVVEVVSPESVDCDRGEKFYEYQEVGVREYWVIDPRTGKARADFWLLDAGRRYQPVLMDGSGRYRSTVIPGFWFDTNWCFGEERPDPLFCFAQIVGLPETTVEQLRQIAARGPQQT
jgi:hypothetical protein